MNLKLKPFQFLIICISISFFSACKTALIPQYVKVENVSKLKAGMNKKQVLSNLENVYPNEILNGTGDCEIHEYLYLKPHRSLLNLTGVLDRDELTGGKEKYFDENSAVVVYRNKKLSMVYTNGGPEQMADILNVQNEIKVQCENELIIPKGCTDPLSLSYDPDALEDDGSCEYCDCGMVPNPSYNDKRPLSNCNTKCVSEDLVDANGQLIKKTTNGDQDECSKCDLIDAIKGSGASVTINLNSKKSKNNNNSSFSLVKTSSKSKGMFARIFSKKNKGKSKKSKIKLTNNTNNGVPETRVVKVY